MDIDITRPSRALAVADAANALMLAAGVLGVVAGLTMLPSQPISAMTAMALIFMGLNAYCAWIGWKNTTVGLLRDRRTWRALIIFGALNSFATLVFWRELAEGSARSVSPLFYSAFAVAAAVTALGAMFVLPRLRLTRIDLPVGLFLRHAHASVSAAPRLAGAAARNRPLGLGLILLGIAWLAASALIPQSWIPVSAERYAAQFGAIGFLFFAYARYQLRPTAAALRAADTRPPVVFFRSFKDDAGVDQESIGSAWFDFSLESRLADHFSATLGPVIAGQPAGTEAMILGAARSPLQPASWTTEVSQWMDDAALILVMVGATAGVTWELRRALERGHSNKLIIVFPELKQAAAWSRLKQRWHGATPHLQSEFETRLASLATAFDGSIWSDAIAGLQALARKDWRAAMRCRAIVLNADGTLQTVSSRSRSRASFHLAALVARFLQAGETADAVSRAAAPRRVWRVVAAGTVAVILLGVGLAGVSLVQSDSRWGRRTANMLGILQPLPPTVTVSGHGGLRAGNLRFANDASSPTRAGIYLPGERFRVEYSLMGHDLDANELTDIHVEAFALDPFGEKTSSVAVQDIRLPGEGQVIDGFLVFDLDRLALAGDYALRVTAEDRIGRSSKVFTIPFRVGGSRRWAALAPPNEMIATAGPLRLGNARFSRKLDGDPISVFGPRDSVFLSFDLASFGRDKERFSDLLSRADVLTSSGELAIAIPEERVRQSPAAGGIVRGGYGITLSDAVPDGTYIIVVYLRDTTNGATLSARFPFEVRRPQ